MLEIISAYAETELASNSEEFSRTRPSYQLRNKRFFGYTRARYFLMYLSAISAPRTSSEFGELDGKGGIAGRRENRSPSDVVYVLTNLHRIKRNSKKEKAEKKRKETSQDKSLDARYT